MAKRILEIPTPQPPKKKPREITTPPPPPLSPAEITSPQSHATINGMVASVSPIKPSKYFDGELTDGDTIIRFVGFRKEQRQLLHSFCEEKKPITIKNCQVQWNKFKNHLEVVLKSASQVELSQTEFDIPNLKTVGSSEITLDELEDYEEYSRVTFKAQVKKVGEPHTVGGGKLKQEILLCDSTSSATLTLWEDDINMMIEGKSYQMNRLVVRSFLGKNHLSMPPSGASIEEINDLENVIATTSSITEGEHDEYLTNVTISGVQQLESLHICINCKKEIHPASDTVTTCAHCETTQREGNCRQTAKLFIKTEHTRITVRAYHEALTSITQKDEVDCENLLFAPPFDMAYNKYHVITKVSRN